LTALSKSWRNQQDFIASNYIFWAAKQLVAEKGIVSKPNVKPDELLPPATPTMVRQFLYLMKSA
jgi:hypothetical protein